jgi:predicted esterase
MSLQVLEAQTGEHPVASVIILHGLGADGRDFVPVAEQMDLSSVGALRYIFPSAPVMPITINGGRQVQHSLSNSNFVTCLVPLTAWHLKSTQDCQV